MFLTCNEDDDYHMYAMFFSSYFLLKLKIAYLRELLMLQLNTIPVIKNCNIDFMISLIYASHQVKEFGSSVILLYVNKQVERKKAKNTAVKNENVKNCEGAGKFEKISKD